MGKIINRQRSQNKAKLARMEIVAKLYRRQYSYHQIRREVMQRLNLKTYSLSTLHKDVQTLLQEWRDERLTDMNDILEVELQRIDDTCRELWDQWEKSKNDRKNVTKHQAGKPVQKGGKPTVKTLSTHMTESNVYGLGNPSYIAEIRAQLQERRKLLGLYAPEKREVSGSLSFAQLLMESGMIEDTEKDV